MPVLCPRRARASTAILIADPSYQRFDWGLGIARITGSMATQLPIFPLETIVEEPLSFEFEVPFAREELDREPLVAVRPARIAGEVTPVEGGHALTASLAWDGRLECSRCLADYDFSHQEDFTLVLYPRKAISEADLELDREDLDAYFYDDPNVPVAPIVEERIQMAIPMKPLCSEDCLGLCVQCGTDRNINRCDCVVEFIDPRWRALELLKQQKS